MKRPDNLLDIEWGADSQIFALRQWRDWRFLLQRQPQEEVEEEEGEEGEKAIWDC